jgi:hypothetical protein
VFGCAALWFERASLAGSGRGWRARLPALLHTLMAGAMIWMLTAAPAVSGMPLAGSAGGAMAPMSRAATPAPVLVVSILLAMSCAAVSFPWLARPSAPGAGMAAMLFATL